MTAAVVWPEERTETLKALFAGKQHSESEMASILGVTRCAVGGKLHRLGLVRGEPGHPSPRIRPKPDRTGKNDGGMAYRVVNGIRKRQAAPDDPEPFECKAVDVVPLHLTFGQLRDGDRRCRYPYGTDPATMTFCGHYPVHERLIGTGADAKMADSSYCKPHYLICTNPWKGRAG